MDVTHVLEGSVRKAGNRHPGSARSWLPGMPGRHLWADHGTVTSPTSSPFRTRFRHAIAKALELKLLPEEKQAIEHRGTSNAEAYRFPFDGQAAVDRRHFRRPQAATRRYCAHLSASPVQLDPNYAEAWSSTAIAQAEAAILAREGRQRAAGGRACPRSGPIFPKRCASRRATWRKKVTRRRRTH